jgi:CheY-like chemotaxis protein
VPPWKFIEELLIDVAAERGVAATPEAIDVVRRQHQAAQRTNASMTKALAQLQQQLADADWEARRTAAHKDVLDDALLERNQRIADLQVRLNIEASSSVEADADTLLAERNRLAAEVARLRAQMSEAQTRVAQAEARCALLERQLSLVEVQRGRDGEDVFPAVESVRHLLPAGTRPKVLLVDDRPANLLALKNVLEVPDQELVPVSSGQDALKVLLQHEDFAVIILDVQMPSNSQELWVVPAYSRSAQLSTTERAQYFGGGWVMRRRSPGWPDPAGTGFAALRAVLRRSTREHPSAPAPQGCPAL